MPQIKLVGSQENKFSAFGHSQGNLIVVRVTQRHPIDICRTLAHEMMHFKQNLLKMSTNTNFREDNANMMAGRIMKKFDVTHPEVFKDKAVRANMFHTLHEDALGGCAVNSMGSGGIATFDPLLGGMPDKRKKEGFDLKKLYKKQNPKNLRSVFSKP
jgi:hypothetical protein